MDSQRAPHIFAKHPDRASRLHELNLNEAVLREAVEFGLRFAFECTEHDPPSLAGILAWGKITRALRERLVPLGWTRDNTRNFATTIHPNGACAIVVAAGDANTGLPDRQPSTRSEKGPATVTAIGQNQLSFADIDPKFPMPPEATMRKQTWFLLHFADEELDEIRCELALPEQMTADGVVVAWRERIILDGIRINPSPTIGIADEDSGEIVIDIGRRAG